MDRLSCSNINDPEMRKECKKQVVLEEYERLSPDLLFEIIRQDGEEELNRSTKALVYSGIAAGIVISSSFLFKAVLMEHTSFVSWGNLIASLGYTVGFIIVILGRMQLFTENTITTVVPLFYERSMKKFIQVVRLWGIVLLSNLIGTCLAAAFLSNSLLVSADVAVQLHEIAVHVVHMVPMENIIRGIPAGILIAAVVWMMPMSRSFSFFMILFFTYFISLGDFAHIVVGSCEMAYAVFHGDAGLYQYFFTFLLPTGIGNIIGGTFVFTLLVYAQVSSELSNH